MVERSMLDRFTHDFNSELSNEITREETFERAKKRFEDVCGFTPYRSYRSYRTASTAKKRRG